MQGNLQLADGPFNGLIDATGVVAHAAAPYAAVASFTFFGAALVLGVLAAYGLMKLAEKARYRRFRRQVMVARVAKSWSKPARGARVLEPAE